MVSSEDINRFLELCYEGNLEEVVELLRQDPTLIKCKDETGNDQFKVMNRIRKNGRFVIDINNTFGSFAITKLETNCRK